MSSLRFIIVPVLAAISGLILSGCIEESTVIKINRDGSGIIHERSYSADSDKVISLPGLSTNEDGNTKAEEAETKLPSETALKDYAATLGEGVSLQSVKASTNKKGWKGYEIIYKFEDINKVRYMKDTPKPDAAEEAEDAAKKPRKDKKKDEFVATFAMKDGHLAITMQREGLKKGTKVPVQAPDSPTIDPYADTTGPSPAEVSITSQAMNETMLKAMTKGMRMGIFVQVEGEIAETNAAHRNGNLITLFNADLGTLFDNEGGMGVMDQLNTVDRAQFQAIADELEGLDVDLQEPIVVRFK